MSKRKFKSQQLPVGDTGYRGNQGMIRKFLNAANAAPVHHTDRPTRVETEIEKQQEAMRKRERKMAKRREQAT